MLCCQFNNLLYVCVCVYHLVLVEGFYHTEAHFVPQCKHCLFSHFKDVVKLQTWIYTDIHIKHKLFLLKDDSSFQVIRFSIFHSLIPPHFMDLLQLSVHHFTSTNKTCKSTTSTRINSEPSCSLFAIAVPAPTDLGFGQVESDSIEVTWVSPHVPNPADINNFLVRYEQKHNNVLKAQYCLIVIEFVTLTCFLLIQVSSH